MGQDLLEALEIAVDAQAKARGASTQTITLNLAPATRMVVHDTGVRMLNRLDLPPGRYQLRMAAEDTGQGRVGSLLYDLEVPDFYKEPFSMSGLALTSLGGGMMTARADAQLKDVLPAPPTAARACMSLT